MTKFWQLRDWIDFNLNGVTYMKLRPQYTNTGAIVNALNKSTGQKVYIIPNTEITPSSTVHEQQLTPIVCRPVLVQR